MGTLRMMKEKRGRKGREKKKTAEDSAELQHSTATAAVKTKEKKKKKKEKKAFRQHFANRHFPARNSFSFHFSPPPCTSCHRSCERSGDGARRKGRGKNRPQSSDKSAVWGFSTGNSRLNRRLRFYSAHRGWEWGKKKKRKRRKKRSRTSVARSGRFCARGGRGCRLHGRNGDLRGEGKKKQRLLAAPSSTACYFASILARLDAHARKKRERKKRKEQRIEICLLARRLLTESSPNREGEIKREGGGGKGGGGGRKSSAGFHNPRTDAILQAVWLEEVVRRSSTPAATRKKEKRGKRERGGVLRGELSCSNAARSVLHQCTRQYANAAHMGVAKGGEEKGKKGKSARDWLTLVQLMS